MRSLPELTWLFPSWSGRALSGKAASTIGFERRFNRGFKLQDREGFVELMLKEGPPRLSRAAEIRAANLGLTEQ
jgi:hypothetical protein